MSQLILTKSRTAKRGYAKRNVERTIDMSPMSLVIAVSLFILVISTIYVFNFNQVAMKGHDIARLDGMRMELTDVNERASNELSALQSLGYIEESEVVNRMVKPREVIFVESNSRVAVLD